MGVLSTLVDYMSAPTIIVLLFTCTVYLFVQNRLCNTDDFPFINKYSSDWTNKKAKAAFAQDASGLIRDGFAKVSSAVRATSMRF
jgi:hypothetical protein